MEAPAWTSLVIKFERKDFKMLFQDYLDEVADLLKTDPDLPRTNEFDDISHYMTDSPRYTADQVNALAPLWRSYLKKTRRAHNRFGVKQRSINLPIPLNHKIEDYQKRNNIQSYTQAAIFLIEKGLR